MSTTRRSRRDSAVILPTAPAEFSSQDFAREDSPRDHDEWNETQRFLSEPTTPRTKKKCHFIEPSDEFPAPRRQNTAPPGFPSPSPTTTGQEPSVQGISNSEELQEDDLISFEEPEEASTEAIQEVDEISLRSHEGDANFYDLETEAIDIDMQDDSTPTEELPHVSYVEDDGRDEPDDRALTFRRAKSHSVSSASVFPQARTSVQTFYRTSSASGLYSKPAYSPIIKAHVAATPARFDFHTTPTDDGDGEERGRADDKRSPTMSRSYTASSKSSNSACSVTWDDKLLGSASEESGPPSETCSPGGDMKCASGSKKEFTLEAIKQKLSTMSRREYSTGHSSGKRRSEQSSSAEEASAAAPKIRTASHTPRKGHGGYPARHSRSSGSSPIPTPLVMRSEPQSPAPGVVESAPLKPALKVGAVKSVDRFGASHRDSIELARHRLQQAWPVTDAQLASTQDSIILAKQRFDKYPKSQLIIDGSTGQLKYGGLSPIMDASPPDPRVYWAARREQMAKKKECVDKEVKWQREIGGHGETDDKCCICEVERPRSKRKASV